MIHRKTGFPIQTLPRFQQHFLTEDMLLFDIETTGLSAARDSIYCIGCGYRTGGKIVTELFFAEKPTQEPEVIAAFFELLKHHHTVVTFNGTAFDIPFIRKRCALYNRFAFSKWGDSLSAFRSIDLYREAAGMKSLLRLPSYRQKAIEEFLGCSREDRFDGGQLIEIYHQYASAPDPEKLSFLLLHNEEDIRGMFDLTGLLSLHQLRDGAFDITDLSKETGGTESFCNISIRPELPFVQRISLLQISPTQALSPQNSSSTSETISLLLEKEAGLIRFPVLHGTLRHYFPDPENYFYLPEEDCAVHKSVGVFVDPSHRRKATKQNCCSRLDCDYITAPAKTADSFLRREFRDKCSCLALPAKSEDVMHFLRCFFSIFFRPVGM